MSVRKTSLMDAYIRGCNERQAKTSLASCSPIEYRHALGLLSPQTVQK